MLISDGNTICTESNHTRGYDNFFNSRNLDVYITKLRSYIKEDPSLEIITIKGIGYRFVTG